MNQNPDTPPNNNTSKELFFKPATELAEQLSVITGATVKLSIDSDYEIKVSSLSSVARLDYDLVFDLSTCNINEIYDSLEGKFTNDEFRRELCTTLGIAKIIHEALLQEPGLINDFEIEDAMKIFPNLETVGFTMDEVMYFFSTMQIGTIVGSSYLESLFQGKFTMEISFASKSMRTNNVKALEQEIAMYESFSNEGIRTFCAFSKVFVNKEKDACYNFTSWRRNMFLHAHNNNFFSQRSDILQRTNNALLFLHRTHLHGDLHFYNIASEFDYELGEEIILFFDLVRARRIDTQQNLGLAVWSDVMVYCSNLRELFNFRYKNGSVSNEDAENTIRVMLEYKEGLIALCEQQPNEAFRDDQGMKDYVTREVEDLIRHINFLLHG